MQPAAPDAAPAAAADDDEFEWVRLRTPLQHRPVATQLRFVARAGAGDPLFPFATRRERPDVVMPQAFEPFLSSIATATFFQLQGTCAEAFDESLGEACSRLADGRPREEVLRGFAAALDRGFAPVFGALPEREKATVRSLCDAALRQVVMHECAHHYLGHFELLRQRQIARKDAEFEADLFAVLNGIEAGEPPSSMYYFFSALAAMEASTQGLGSAHYDSFTERRSNVEAIVACLGFECTLLTDAAFGGGFSLSGNSPDMLRSACDELLQRPEPDFDGAGQGRLAAAVLGEMHAELRSLLARLAADAPLLFSTDASFDPARAGALTRSLAEAARSFRHLHQIAAKCIALFLRRWGLRGRPLAPLADSVEMLADQAAVAGRFHCDDLGRIHQAIGLSILQERTDLAAAQRLDLARARLLQAVDLNPRQSEAWCNLAFVSFKQGRCDEAARFADLSLKTLTEEGSRESAQFFADRMHEFAADEAACRARAAQFHPYPGM
jgi:tetratricopeptide (TPR) repeat protein